MPSGRGRWAADFAESKGFRQALWGLYRISRDGSRRPSELLDVHYPWVAADLDAAVSMLASHVEAEFHRRRDAADKENRPKEPASSKGRRGPKAGYKPLPEWRVDEIWVETVSDVVEDRLIFHLDSLDGKQAAKKGSRPLRWRVEKLRTGDPALDERRDAGARVLFDEHGRKRAIFNAVGKRTYHWSPAGAGVDRGR